MMFAKHEKVHRKRVTELGLCKRKMTKLAAYIHSKIIMLLSNDSALVIFVSLFYILSIMSNDLTLK